MYTALLALIIRSDVKKVSHRHAAYNRWALAIIYLTDMKVE